MRIVRSGVSRIVVVAFGYAIKVPRFWPLRRLRKGLAGNRMEGLIWREQAAQLPWLCPVLYVAPGGVISVMPAVTIMTWDEFFAFNDSPEYPQAFDQRLFEGKADDWGFLNGRPVVVDYAIQVHLDDPLLNQEPPLT